MARLPATARPRDRCRPRCRPPPAAGAQHSAMQCGVRASVGQQGGADPQARHRRGWGWRGRGRGAWLAGSAAGQARRAIGYRAGRATVVGRAAAAAATPLGATWCAGVPSLEWQSGLFCYNNFLHIHAAESSVKCMACLIVHVAPLPPLHSPCLPGTAGAALLRRSYVAGRPPAKQAQARPRWREGEREGVRPGLRQVHFFQAAGAWRHPAG